MKHNYNEISVIAVKKWKDQDGKRHQKTMRFFQTVSPFNRNDSGAVKSRKEIMDEIMDERKKWLEAKL